MKHRLFALVLLAASPLGSAPSPTDEASLLSKKNSYEKRAEQELNEWSRKIQDLKSRSEKAGADTRKTVDRELHHLETDLSLAQKRLDTLKTQTAEEWQKFTSGIDKTLNDLKRTYAKTTAKFK